MSRIVIVTSIYHPHKPRSFVCRNLISKYNLGEVRGGQDYLPGLHNDCDELSRSVTREHVSI
jgi:hypothetical protein